MTTTTTRRAILAGIAAAPVAALPAAATALGPNDRRLLAMEALWRARMEAGRIEADEDESGALYEQAGDIEHELLKTPADTLAGLRVKLRVARYELFEANGRDLDPYSGMHDFQDHAAASLICDIERLIGGAA